jgi:hypothetical protein
VGRIARKDNEGRGRGRGRVGGIANLAQKEKEQSRDRGQDNEGRGRQHTTRQDKASNFVNKKKRKTKKKRKRREEHDDEPYVVRGECGQPQKTQQCQRRRQPVGNKRNEEITIRKTQE